MTLFPLRNVNSLFQIKLKQNLQRLETTLCAWKIYPTYASKCPDLPPPSQCNVCSPRRHLTHFWLLQATFEREGYNGNEKFPSIIWEVSGKGFYSAAMSMCAFSLRAAYISSTPNVVRRTIRNLTNVISKRLILVAILLTNKATFFERYTRHTSNKCQYYTFV